MARLAAYVHVVSPTGSQCAFGPDDVVPDWAVALITNPAAWDEPPAPAKEPAAPRAKRPTQK